MGAAKVNGVAAPQVSQLKLRDGDHSGFQFREGFPKSCKIGGVGKKGEICIDKKSNVGRELLLAMGQHRKITLQR